MFLERDGTPIGGQVPMEVRYSGGGNYSTVAADVGALVRAFVNNVRQSLVPTHCETLPLPGNGFVELRYEYGSMMVDVYLPPADDAGGPFYGGILINPHVITGDEDAYLSLAGNPTPWRVPDAVKSGGTLPGRPAVPGTGDAATEWLVVQISRDLPLTGNPLATGAVRMFRIDSPLFGPFCEVAEPGRYAVSTIDGSAFFMCGRQLDHVPPMPAGLPALTRSSEAGGGPSPSRIRTVGMQPASFTDAHATEGIIIFALVNQLWALNTRERTEFTPAPWRLLHEVPMPRDYPADYLPNEFGSTFSVTVAGGNYTLTCSGTNAVGTCSGFTVDINALGTMSGTLTLVDSGFRASVAHEQTVSFTGSYSRPGPEIQVDTWDMGLPSVDVMNYPTMVFSMDGVDAIRCVAYKALGLQETHTLEVAVVGPTPAIVPDTLLNGTMPRRADVYQRTFLEFGQTQCDFADLPYRLKGFMRDNVIATYRDGAGAPLSTTLPDSHVGQAYSDYWANVTYTGVAGITSSPASGDPMWLSPQEFVDFYVDAYAEWTVLECDDPTQPYTFRQSVAGEYDPAGVIGQPWTQRVMGVLYVNTKENNDRVFQWVETNYDGVNTNDIYHLERREGPTFAQPRYKTVNDFDHRLAFPGITPFATQPAATFITPTDLPVNDPSPPYPGTFVNYNPGTTKPEMPHWFPFWSSTEAVVDSGGTPIGGGVIANFEGELICRYPKRAAVFDAYEHYEIVDSYSGSLLGRSFVTSKTREAGALVANEHMAHLLPSNIDTFDVGTEGPDTTTTDDRQAEAGSTYDRDPYLRYAYTARDWHCDTMGWRRDAGRTGSWFIEDRPLRRFANNGECALLHDTADRVEASHTLYRAGGSTVMTFPDLLSFYPLRSTHGSLSLATNIVNVGAPYLQHDLVYLDKRFPELDVCDSIGIPQTGGLGGTAYNLDEGDTFFFDTECLPRREWMPGGPYRDGWTPNRPQLLVGYWGRDPGGGARDPLFPVPGYWIANPEEDPPEGEEYIHVPHITEASETAYDLTRPEYGFSPDFSGGLFLASPRGAEFYELQARNFLGDIGTAFDALYVDNRTGGFITQVLWSGNGGRICETYIGNSTGVVPFRPIFDAWLAQGGGAPADGTRVAIVRPSTAIGGPAAGPIDAQLVSLL